jgi:hypothetical protein
MVDMTNNRVPYGLLIDEEKAALHNHYEAGGNILVFVALERGWHQKSARNVWPNLVYRTVPLPEKTQDVIAWDRLPDWVEWVARDEDSEVRGSAIEPILVVNHGFWAGPDFRIDDFPGIVQIGTVDWKDSKQRRPRCLET